MFFIKESKTCNLFLFINSSFRAKCGIDGIIGCVDGTHVTLSGLSRNVEHAYVDREHQHSLNVMLVIFSI